MTVDEILNAAKTRLLDGRGPARTPYGACYYRTPGTGLPCLVGALITDEEYTKEMDDTGDVHCLLDNGLLPIRLQPHIALLSELQGLHDRAPSWNQTQFIGKNEFNNLVQHYGGSDHVKI